MQQPIEEDFRESCALGNVKNVRYYIQKGVDVNDQNKTNGFTGLHWAYQRGHDELVTLLLKNGASNELLDSKNRKPSELQKGVAPLKIVPNYLQNPETFKLWEDLSKLDPQMNSINNESTQNAQSTTHIVTKTRTEPASNSVANLVTNVEIKSKHIPTTSKSEGSFKILVFNNKKPIGNIIISSTKSIRQLIQQIRAELLFRTDHRTGFYINGVPVGKGQLDQGLGLHFDGEDKVFMVRHHAHFWRYLVFVFLVLTMVLGLSYRLISKLSLFQ
jgi:hypothetical protein